MWRRRKAEPPPPPKGSTWQGELGFEVLGAGTGKVGYLTCVLDTDELRFRMSGRDLGSLPRDQFRAWLQQPVGALMTEWLQFTNGRRSLLLSMGATRPPSFPLPRAFEEQLRHRI